ncbi:hypothetical protein IWZ03DRAFT_238501 [Phyllosticta citriasiana]|uniref:Secreted protein n=1 Tax=Phyllosticta citriasiana TaxID=595635 RepID=A0ABR1KF71_9PEZI
MLWWWWWWWWLACVIPSRQGGDARRDEGTRGQTTVRKRGRACLGTYLLYVPCPHSSSSGGGGGAPRAWVRGCARAPAPAPSRTKRQNFGTGGFRRRATVRPVHPGGNRGVVEALGWGGSWRCASTARQALG